MRKPLSLLAGMLAFGAAAPAPTQATTKVVPSALLPLSDKDTELPGEIGCQFAFAQGNDTFLYLINDKFLARTDAGLSQCIMSQREIENFGAGPVSVSCGGRKYSVRPTGPGKSYPEADSSVGPAMLTMTEAGKSRTVKGQWSSAC